MANMSFRTCIPESEFLTMDFSAFAMTKRDKDEAALKYVARSQAPITSPVSCSSPADGYLPPYPAGRSYFGCWDEPGVAIASFQRAAMRREQEQWAQSERVIREGWEGGSEEGVRTFNTNADAVNEMLRENGVLPVDEPTGFGAGWDSKLQEKSEDRSHVASTRSYAWVTRLQRRLSKGLSEISAVKKQIGSGRRIYKS